LPVPLNPFLSAPEALPVLTSVAAVCLAGLGSLATTCLLGYSPTLLDQFLEEAKRTDREGRNAEIEKRETEYLTVATIYTAAGWVLGTWSVLQITGALSLGFVGFVVVMLVLASCLPVAVARRRAEPTLLAILPFVRPGWFLLRWPVVVPLLLATRAALRVLRLRPPATPDAADVQKQVIAAVADSVTEDTLADAERTWIGNIVGLKDQQVSTLMTPRAEIAGFPDAMPVRDAVKNALEQGFSRYPVYHDRIDVVVGVFYVKDALRLLQPDATTRPDACVRDMMREPLFVPESMAAARLLRRFQAGNQHMAIVLDEHGTTTGLVTVEDLIEAIVGEISDEYDSPPADGPNVESDSIAVVEAGRVLDIPARTTVTEVNQLLGTELPESGDWETVAGLVIAKLAHIPIVGETTIVDGVEFRVLAADERKIERLRVTVLSPQHAEESK